jgi:hypothetical protein
MKKINLAIIAITFCSLIGCTSEDSDSRPQDVTTSNIVTILNEIVEDNAQSNDFISFDLNRTNDGDYLIKEQSFIEKNFVSEFSLEYDKEINSHISLQFNAGRSPAKVCCSIDGNEQGCTTCESGEEQGSCVGSLITDCLSDGDCGTVCPQRVIYNPKTKEFIIILI